MSDASQQIKKPSLRPSEVSVPALAYLGDSVLEVLVRTYLVTERGLSTAAHLNRAALDFVRASAQADAVRRMEPHLSDEEAGVYRRGRNMGHGSVPKNASPSEYRRATGMEALFGYLFLSGKNDRLRELFAIGYLSEEPLPVPTEKSQDTEQEIRL